MEESGPAGLEIPTTALGSCVPEGPILLAFPWRLLAAGNVEHLCQQWVHLKVAEFTN